MSEAEFELLRAAVAHMPESLGVFEPDGSILFVNAALERRFGLPRSALLGRRLYDVFPDARGSAFHQAFERVRAGGPAETFEHYFAPRDRWFSSRVENVDGKVHVCARDVTDDVRRRRRLELQAALADVITAEDVERGSATHAVAERLARFFDADVTIAKVVDEGRFLETVGLSARDEETSALAARMPRWPVTGYAATAIATRAPVLVGGGERYDTSRLPEGRVRETVGTYGPSSLLLVPLLVGEHVVGLLFATRRHGEVALTDDERAIGAEVAPALSLHVAHARRRDEAASLRHRLTAFADSLPALLAFVDKNERYRYVNRAYREWFGSDRPFVGHTIREMAETEDAYARLQPHLARVLAGEAVRFRNTFSYPSGRRDVDVQYLPIRDADGTVEELAVLVQDVTSETRLASVERAQTRRLERILSLTGKLAAAAVEDEVLRVLVDEGIEVLEASMCSVYLLSADGTHLDLVRQRGFSPEHVALMARTPLTADHPVVECVKTGKPVWAASRAQYAASYPAVERAHRPEDAPPLSFVLSPLLVEGRAIGVFGILLREERELLREDRTVVEILASHGAEALRRARLYAALREVSSRHEAMIQASPAAIMLLDERGVVHAWNPAAEAMFGWTAEEVLGQPLPAVDGPREDFLVNLRQVLDGAVLHGREARRRRKNGETFPVELYAAAVRGSDGGRMCLSMVVDVTEKKRNARGRALLEGASATLSRSLEWRSTLAEVARLPLEGFADWCGVHLLDEGGMLRPVAAEGADDASVTARTVAVDPERGGVSLAVATRQPVLLREMDDASLRALARDDAQLAFMRAQGWRSGMAIPLLAGDRVVGALSLVSRTRSFDDADLAIATELGRRVTAAVENARLYDEATAARNDAEAANRAKDEFLAVLGHELRNPLAPIATAVHLLELRAPGEAVRERAVIKRQVAHLSRLVDDLLDVSRIARGKVELRREPTTVGEAVAAAVELASSLLETRRHHLTVDVAPDLFVFGDPARLRQIASNVLSNAAKYTPEGGHIEVRARREGANVELVVRDDGVGVPPELLPRIFESFVQAPQPIARSTGGLGLGLTIVRSLVELHGGRVSLASEGLSKGTTVTIVLPSLEATRAQALPANTTATATADEAPTDGPSRSPSRRVLVVDDNEDAALLLGDLLGARGHDARIAFDGPSALELAREFQPDVAILDIGLPVMDGYELASRLRAMSGERDVRLIALTGYSQHADKQRARGAGFDAHLAKPVQIDALLDIFEPS